MYASNMCERGSRGNRRKTGQTVQAVYLLFNQDHIAMPFRDVICGCCRQEEALGRSKLEKKKRVEEREVASRESVRENRFDRERKRKKERKREKERKRDREREVVSRGREREEG